MACIFVVNAYLIKICVELIREMVILIVFVLVLLAGLGAALMNG